MPRAAWPALVIVVAVALFVVQSSLRSALAEAWIGESSLTSLERAVAATPERPLAWMRLGIRQSRDEDAADAVRSLQTAVERAPGASAPRIALALELERTGRFDEAEKALLSAAASDAGFRPRWNLANYYVRRGNWDQVWHWVHESILADHSQLAAAASLAWRAEADPATIFNLGIPDEPEINRRYFAYLYDLGELDAMRQAWPRYSAAVTETETPLATQYVDRLIAAGFVDEAVDVWNFLCERELMPHAALRQADGLLLTNSSFLQDPSGRGFDWTAHEHRGVRWSRQPVQGTSGALDFRLSGAQPSGVTLLSQVVPATPGTYELRFDIATQGMPIRSGLGWVVRDLYSGAEIHPFATLSNAEGFWDSESLTFSVPGDAKAVVLELRFVEIESKSSRRGGFALRNLRLSLLEALEAASQ